MDRANAIFDQIDADKSGEIDSKELMMALLGLGQEHETVSDLFRVLDTDGNGSISREEFLAGFDLYQAAATKAAQRFERMEKMMGEMLTPGPDIMLLKVADLLNNERLLEGETGESGADSTALTSDDILQQYWKAQQSIAGLFGPGSFKTVPFWQLESTKYGVLTYCWGNREKGEWGPAWKQMISALKLNRRLKVEYVWMVRARPRVFPTLRFARPRRVLAPRLRCRRHLLPRPEPPQEDGDDSSLGPDLRLGKRVPRDGLRHVQAGLVPHGARRHERAADHLLWPQWLHLR